MNTNPKQKKGIKDQEATANRKNILFKADLQIYTQTRNCSNPQQFKGELHKHKIYFTREKMDPSTILYEKTDTLYIPLDENFRLIDRFNTDFMHKLKQLWKNKNNKHISCETTYVHRHQLCLPKLICSTTS